MVDGQGREGVEGLVKHGRWLLVPHVMVVVGVKCFLLLSVVAAVITTRGRGPPFPGQGWSVRVWVRPDSMKRQERDGRAREIVIMRLRLRVRVKMWVAVRDRGPVDARGRYRRRAQGEGSLPR